MSALTIISPPSLLYVSRNKKGKILPILPFWMWKFPLCPMQDLEVVFRGDKDEIPCWDGHFSCSVIWSKSRTWTEIQEAKSPVIKQLDSHCLNRDYPISPSLPSTPRQHDVKNSHEYFTQTEKRRGCFLMWNSVRRCKAQKKHSMDCWEKKKVVNRKKQMKKKPECRYTEKAGDDFNSSLD